MSPLSEIWAFFNQYFNPFKVLWAGVFYALAAFAFTGGILFLLRRKIIGENSTFAMRWLKRLYILFVAAAALFFGFKIGIITGLQREIVPRLPIYLKYAEEAFRENTLRELGEMQHHSVGQSIDDIADMLHRQQLILLEKGAAFGLPAPVAGGIKSLGERRFFANSAKMIIRLMLRFKLKLKGADRQDVMENTLKELLDDGLLTLLAGAYINFIALIAKIYAAFIFAALILLPPLAAWIISRRLNRKKKKKKLAKPRKKTA